ncbi:MAG: hypothetical protein LLG45_08995 [Actinomycetia bacterium]|nr:hypothetical protein [Actinomycetes bacterium]
MSKDASIRHISIRSIRKNPPDYTKLGRALIQLAQAKAEAEAEAEAQAQKDSDADSSASPTDDKQPTRPEEHL